MVASTRHNFRKEHVGPRPKDKQVRDGEESKTQDSGAVTTRWERLAALCVVLATFAVYMLTLHPSLPGGDSGELVVAAYEFGVAHPPGYPLFTLLSMLAMKVVPGEAPVWRVNVMCAWLAALASGLIYTTVYSLTRSCGAGLLGAAMFSLSRLVWAWSGCAEVFSLNNFLLAALMLTAVRLDTGHRGDVVKMSYVGAFLCGLCLSNQHTSVLYIIVLVPWVMLRLWRTQLLSFSLILGLSAACILGLSPYLYLPVSAVANQARWTWGDQSSLTGFLRHLLRQEYGTWDLLKDHSGQGFLVGLQSYVQHVSHDLSLPVSVLAALSTWSVYSRYRSSGRSCLAMFTLMFLVYVAFFCWRANLDISNPLFLKVVERFWLQSDLVLVVLAAVCFADVCRVISNKLSLSGSHLDVLLAVPLVAWQLHHGWTSCDNSSNTVVQDFALQSLATFPTGAIVLTKGDLPSNSFRYFHLCENVRPDLSVFDQEVLTYSWSLPMTRAFYPNMKFPGDSLHLRAGRREDGRTLFTFRDLIAANYHRPIFACIGVQEYEPSWKKDYVLWPYSVCWRIVKKSEKLDIGQWSRTTARLADQWNYTWDRFEDGSWERVANDEMWRAKTATGFFYLELALTLPDNSQEYFHLLTQAYEMYTSALDKASHISSRDNVPPFWHRNFAIICERLTRVPPDNKHKPVVPDQLGLVRLTTHHFRQYLRLAPSDPDAARIQAVVGTLQDYLDKMGAS